MGPIKGIRFSDKEVKRAEEDAKRLGRKNVSDHIRECVRLASGIDPLAMEKVTKWADLIRIEPSVVISCVLLNSFAQGDAAVEAGYSVTGLPFSVMSFSDMVDVKGKPQGRKFYEDAKKHCLRAIKNEGYQMPYPLAKNAMEANAEEWSCDGLRTLDDIYDGLEREYGLSREDLKGVGADIEGAWKRGMKFHRDNEKVRQRFEKAEKAAKK